MVLIFTFLGVRGEEQEGNSIVCTLLHRASAHFVQNTYHPILTVLWFYKILHVTMQEKWPTKALLYVVNSHPPFPVHPVLPEQNLSKKHIALKLTL